MIKVITDSSCDLPDQTLAEYGIEMIPLNVIFENGEIFLDRVEISPNEFRHRLYADHQLPKTSVPDLQQFFEVFQKDLMWREGIIFISVSSTLSQTYETALMAKKMIRSDKIRIIDSLSASLGVGMLAIRAVELVNQGLPLNDITHQLIEARNRMETVFTVDTLENLIKGHRLTKYEGLVESILDIKPVFWGVEGQIEVVGRVRGRRRSLQRMVYLLNNFSKGLNGRNITIAHMDCEDDVDYIKEHIEEHYGHQKIMTAEMGSTTGTYMGKGGIIMSCL